MLSLEHKNQVFQELEEKLNKGFRIILFDYCDQELLKKLFNSKKSKQIDLEIWSSINVSNCDLIKILSNKDMAELIEQYCLYEFTDQIRVVSKSSQYGSMLNYLSTGIMTEEEYFEALLH